MIGWVYVTGIVGFFVVLGWMIWDWAASLYAVKLPETCSGCEKHFVRADCPVHGPDRRAA